MTGTVSKFVVDFWNGLIPTDGLSDCPRCSASGQLVKVAKGKGTPERFIFHCNGIQIVSHAEAWQDR